MKASLRQVNNLLNIHPGEGRLVASFVSFYFFLGIGIVLTQTAAFTLFLQHFTAPELSYAYMSIAVGSSGLTLIYLWLARRLPLSILLSVNVIFLAVGGLIFRGGIASGQKAAFFLLPMWFQTVVNLGNIAFWSLAGTVFNVRQSKRLFGLLGSGNWLAVTAGGILIPVLVGLWGTANLLFIAVASFVVALGVLYGVLQRVTLPDTTTTASTESRPSQTNLWSSRFVMSIFALVVVWWIAFFFVDNLFYRLAAAQYPDADELASFIGVLLAAIGIVALATSVLFTRPIVNRFGLRMALLVTPLVILIFLVGLALSGTLDAAVGVLFVFGALAKLVNVALGFSIDQSSRALLFQPLPAEQRIRTQTTADGIIQPLAVGLAGILLLMFSRVFSISDAGLAYLLVGLVLLWMAVVTVTMRDYIGILKRAITRRYLGDTAINLIDKDSITALQEGLHRPQPGAVIYSMRLLAEMNQESLIEALPALLQHTALEVRQESLRHIETLGLVNLLDAVRDCAEKDPTSLVRETAVRVWAALGGATDAVSAYLTDTDLNVRRGAMVGLLRRDAALPTAVKHLNALLQSTDENERILAAQILGEVGGLDYRQQLRKLLSDESILVRRAVLLAVGNTKDPSLWGEVTTALQHPLLRTASRQALALGGADALPEIEKAFHDPNTPPDALKQLARVCGILPDGADLLKQHINHPLDEVRTAVLTALSVCRYQAKDPAPIWQSVQTELQHMGGILAALVDIEEDDSVGLLREALQFDLKSGRERILSLFSFIYDRQSVIQARDALYYGSAEQQAYAIEMLDLLLPNEQKNRILPFMEDLPPQDQLNQLNLAPPRLSREARLNEIVRKAGFSAWTRACADYALGKETSMRSTIEKVIILNTADLFSGTPNHVLAEVAQIVTEVEYGKGETIFQKGDMGSSMYLIVSGKVRVYDGDLTLNYLEAGDVFGEMALLDPEPRLASVTTEEETALFRLDQNTFYELMTNQPEIAQGIIRVLTRHLRARVRDLSKLDARVHELEAQQNL